VKLFSAYFRIDFDKTGTNEHSDKTAPPLQEFLLVDVAAVRIQIL